MSCFPRVTALASVSILIAACGSSEDGKGTSGTQKFEPPGNGVAMKEADACAALQKAEDDRRATLGCGPVTRPSCPGYLRKGNEACLQYDQGTVQGCVEFIKGLATCEAVSTAQCVVKALPGTAPNGCDTIVDAGTDAALDSGSDAGADAQTDAAGDAPADATVEAGSDAAADAQSD